MTAPQPAGAFGAPKPPQNNPPDETRKAALELAAQTPGSPEGIVDRAKTYLGFLEGKNDGRTA